VITGANVEGPITVDSALSAAAARSNGIESKMAGQADVLIVPGLESGALMLRMLMGMFGALAAGVVLGAKVPVVLAGRSDSMEVRTAACVLASLVARASRSGGAQDTQENTLVRAARAVA
jgi:phosphotransacetylase